MYKTIHWRRLFLTYYFTGVASIIYLFCILHFAFCILLFALCIALLTLGLILSFVLSSLTLVFPCCLFLLYVMKNGYVTNEME